MGVMSRLRGIESEIGSPLRSFGSGSDDDAVRRVSERVQEFDAKQVQTAAANVSQLSKDDQLALQMRESDKQRSKQMMGLFVQTAFSGQYKGGQAFSYLAGLALVIGARKLASLDPAYRAKQAGAKRRQEALQRNERFDERQRRVEAGKSPYGLPVPKSLQMAAFNMERRMNSKTLAAHGLRMSMTPETAAAYLVGAEYDAFKKAKECGGDTAELGRIKTEFMNNRMKIRSIAAQDGLDTRMLEEDARALVYSKLCCDADGNAKVGDYSAGFVRIGDEVVSMSELTSFADALYEKDAPLTIGVSSPDRDADYTERDEPGYPDDDGQAEQPAEVLDAVSSFPRTEGGEPDWGRGYGMADGLPSEWSAYTDSGDPCAELVNESLPDEVVSYLDRYAEMDMDVAVPEEVATDVANLTKAVMGNRLPGLMESRESMEQAMSDFNEMMDAFVDGVYFDAGQSLSPGNSLFPEYVFLNRVRDVFDNDRADTTRHVISNVENAFLSMLENGTLPEDVLDMSDFKFKGRVPDVGDSRLSAELCENLAFEDDGGAFASQDKATSPRREPDMRFAGPESDDGCIDGKGDDGLSL